MFDLPGSKPVCLLVVVLALFPAPGDAQSSDARSSDARQEFWPGIDLYVNLNEQSRFFMKYSATRENHLDDYADGQVGGYLDFYLLPLVRKRLRELPDAARDKFLMFRIGYL